MRWTVAMWISFYHQEICLSGSREILNMKYLVDDEPPCGSQICGSRPAGLASPETLLKMQILNWKLCQGPVNLCFKQALLVPLLKTQV